MCQVSYFIKQSHSQSFQWMNKVRTFTECQQWTATTSTFHWLLSFMYAASKGKSEKSFLTCVYIYYHRLHWINVWNKDTSEPFYPTDFNYIQTTYHSHHNNHSGSNTIQRDLYTGWVYLWWTLQLWCSFQESVSSWLYRVKLYWDSARGREGLRCVWLYVQLPFIHNFLFFA